jgi:hypothetical protein
MTLTYDYANKKWDLNPYQMEQANRQTTRTLYLISSFTPNENGHTGGGTTSYSLSETLPSTPAPYRYRYDTIYPAAPNYIVLNLTPASTPASLGVPGNIAGIITGIIDTLKYNDQSNTETLKANQINTAKNTFENKVQAVINATKQGSYNFLQAKDAIAQQKSFLISSGLSETEAQKEIDRMIGSTGQFNNFYAAERVTPWDPSVLPGNLSDTVKERTDLGANFNTYTDGKKGYYLNETTPGKKASIVWDQAVADNNLDILARYGSKEAYAKYDYLQQITDPTKTSTQINLIRGSQAAALSPLVTDYTEKVFPGQTDAQSQMVRDEVQNKIFGLQKVTTDGQTGYQFRDVSQELSSFVANNSTASGLWKAAQSDAALAKLGTNIQGPWTKLTKSLGVNDSMLTDQTSFGSLLARVATLNSSDPKDKKIIDENQQLIKSISALTNDNTFKDLTSYTPEVNDAFTNSVQASEAAQTTKFGEMRTQILQDTINQLKLAKQQEASISMLKSLPIGQDLQAMQTDINNSILGDTGIGGLMSTTGQGLGSKQPFKLDLGLDNIYGSRNGLIYNWQDWFNNTIEKKYAGNIDIPNDYVPPLLRTKENGFVDAATISSWKKYDDAYATLKLNPADFTAKSIVSTVPADYVPVQDRKTVQSTWTAYEEQLKAAVYVDPQTLSSWAKYDDEYKKTGVIPANAPKDYIVPEKRMDKDAQFARDFFSQYLKPRFDASQSIAEFQDYIDVTKNTQNPFQTQDRMDALKLAAQTSVSQWYANLQKLGDSKFNSDYYFDPNQYLKTNGIGDPNNPMLLGSAFNTYASTVAGENAARQTAKVNADWEAAKQGKATTDDYGNSIDWLQQAYRYGIDINDKNAFAKLHYQLVGQKIPEKDANGNIVKDANGNPVIRSFDGAPDVYAPEIAKLYISQVLTPYLVDKANKIGTVFGQFVKPADYVNQVLQAVNLQKDNPQWQQLLSSYGLDPNASLTDIKNELTSALSQDSTTEIKKKIGDLVASTEKPTQLNLGVEYIQRDTTPSGTVTPASGVYAIFKNAGYSGSEQQFYADFMPGSSQEDINLINAAYTPGGAKGALGITTSGDAMAQLSSMASLFGDTSLTEALSMTGATTTSGVTTSGVTTPSLSSYFGGTSETDEVGIGDPFADSSNSFATFTVKPKTSSSSDEFGIGDPFAETSDPFSDSSNLFGTIKANTSSKISSIGNFFPSLSSSSKSNSFADFSSWTSF